MIIIKNDNNNTNMHGISFKVRLIVFFIAVFKDSGAYNLDRSSIAIVGGG